MNYSEFLFVTLLQLYNNSFNKLPYDRMWEDYKVIYVTWETSKFNDSNKTEHDGMIEFFNHTGIKNYDFNLTIEENEKLEQKSIFVRLGVPDYVYSKEKYDNDEIQDLPENSYFIGYEDEDGNECGENGSKLKLQ